MELAQIVLIINYFPNQHKKGFGNTDMLNGVLRFSNWSFTRTRLQTCFQRIKTAKLEFGRAFGIQVDHAFASLTTAFSSAGATPADVVRITLLIKDHYPARLAYLGKKRLAVFGKSPPASSLIPVTLLYTDGVSFKIDAVTPPQMHFPVKSPSIIVVRKSAP